MCGRPLPPSPASTINAVVVKCCQCCCTRPPLILSSVSRLKKNKINVMAAESPQHCITVDSSLGNGNDGILLIDQRRPAAGCMQPKHAVVAFLHHHHHSSSLLCTNDGAFSACGGTCTRDARQHANTSAMYITCTR
jgi:hypothetical protein